MTKTEKKTEQLLIKQLTTACEELKLHNDAFEYLTHHGQLNKLKQTLKVEVFCTTAFTGQQLKQALSIINHEIFKNEKINFFSGEYLSYKEFINKIAKNLNTNIKFIFIPVKVFKILLSILFMKNAINQIDNLLIEKIEYDKTK